MRSRRPLSFEQLRHQAEAHPVDWEAIDFNTPIDRTRPFVCETVTPLYYTSVYSELRPEQALRYNQIVALGFNELVRFFETAIAPHLLTTLMRRPGDLPADLVAALHDFAADERRHSAAFLALSRLSEPAWYATSERAVLHMPAFGERLLALAARRPALFPAVLWTALAMEEKSLAVSRALLRRGDVIEPRYLAVYRAHLIDEVRHVQIDWHLLEHFYARRPAWLRRLNASLFCNLLTNFFLVPARAGRRVVDLLIADHPELRPLGPRMKRELNALSGNPAYHQMMYSREASPITFSLFDRFPEMQSIGRRLLSYEPRPVAEEI